MKKQTRERGLHDTPSLSLSLSLSYQNERLKSVKVVSFDLSAIHHFLFLTTERGQVLKCTGI